MIYLLTAIGLAQGDSSTVHIYAETIHRTTQLTTRTTNTVRRYWLVVRFLIPEGKTVSAWSLSAGWLWDRPWLWFDLSACGKVVEEWIHPSTLVWRWRIHGDVLQYLRLYSCWRTSCYFHDFVRTWLALLPSGRWLYPKTEIADDLKYWKVYKEEVR
jgi:hypothetical protein